MLRLGGGRLTQGFVTVLCILGVSRLALEYFVPAPPHSIAIATGGKGTTFDYFGERYQERFALAGVELDLRETAGALENIRLLQDPNSGVDIGFAVGGISDRSRAPKLSSIGLIYNVPF